MYKTLVKAGLFFSLLLPLLSFAAPKDNSSEFHLLINKLVSAQRDFDNAALSELLHSDYVEVSPAGEVDHRKEVLGFYDKSHKVKGQNSPLIEISELEMKIDGEYAFVIVKETFTIPGSEHKFSMRVSFTFKKTDNSWLFYNAQYTGIRP
ncbi:nuclear transport factor 2 family protein [uncultured Psychrosphaera sp.]|uniref:nuclear transport factor 2 family protein n=1 Tax=uncultured Psychrosphaera sp. TaxID=1403522 RepID=UPI0026272F39|nr:nuclear transport factor 2 family protein [uncultured Psychrosphaera sp.]